MEKIPGSDESGIFLESLCEREIFQNHIKIKQNI